MAVVFDAKCTADTQTNSATTLTNSNLTVGSGANRLLIAMVTFDRALPTITQFQWDKLGTPQNLTAVTSASSSAANQSTAIYALVAPTSGNKQLSITWTGTSEATLACLSFTGVDQTSVAVACPHGTSATGTSTTASVTVTSASGNMVTGSFTTTASGTITATNNNNIFIDNAGTNMDAAGNYANGAATVALTATISVSGLWGAAGCDILAAASGNPFYKLDWGMQKDIIGSTPLDYVRNPSLFPNPIPFNLTDWGPSKSFYSVQQTQPYNNSIYAVTVAASPFYQNTWFTPSLRSPWSQPQQLNTLINLLAQPLIGPDLSTSSFQRSRAPSGTQLTYTNFYANPFAQYDWSKTLERTFLSDSNLPNIALLNPVITGTPFSQLNWPKGSAVPQAPFDISNIMIITTDTTAPFAQYDWSHGEFLPSVPSSTIVLNTNLFTNPIPFNQLNWTKYYQTLTPGRDNLPNIALLNQVVTNPFFFQDFSRPFVPPRVAVDVQSINTNLFTNPVPLNQINWSKPYRIVPIASDQNSLPNIILYQPVPSNPSNPLGIYSWADLYKYVTLYPTTPALLQNLTLILPPPPPDTGPVGGWRWIDGVMRMREKQLDRRDQNASAVMLGKLGGLARAQALTTRQRSNIASKAAQVRWNPPAKKR